MINIRLLVKEANEGKVFEEKSKNILLAGMLRAKILPRYMKYEVKTNNTFKEAIEEEIEFVTNVEEPWKAEVLDMLNFLLDKVNKNIEIEMNEDQTFEFIKNYSNEHPDLLIGEIRDKFKEDERFHPLTLHRVIRKFK
jgi:predicted RNA-binding protein Jag